MGLPPGFTVESQNLRICVNGGELATNLAENRVELTRDQIHQFLLIQQRMTEHPKTNAPVDIVRPLLANDLRAFVPAEQMNRGVDVEVDAFGHVTSITLETRPPNESDARIESALRQIPFFPEIIEGKAFPGKARFVLSAFVP